ncbi:MAG: hypothetical protein WBF13_00720 [Candidatus Zixiibacteriota bacterium]
MMAEHPLGVFALVNPMAERSLRLLTHRLDVGDMGDVGDVGMAIFHFFHRSKMYFENASKLSINSSEAHHKSSWSSQRRLFRQAGCAMLDLRAVRQRMYLEGGVRYQQEGHDQLNGSYRISFPHIRESIRLSALPARRLEDERERRYALYIHWNYPFHHRSWGVFALCRKRE